MKKYMLELGHLYWTSLIWIYGILHLPLGTKFVELGESGTVKESSIKTNGVDRKKK
jgi:hypothetical protein